MQYKRLRLDFLYISIQYIFINNLQVIHDMQALL